ncbi:MAG TPA: hypothetical protein VE641_08210 [Chthoniobacterales bacterium]|nr:hypothetical protein [Chthoniobacterales bacterium]
MTAQSRVRMMDHVIDHVRCKARTCQTAFYTRTIATAPLSASQRPQKKNLRVARIFPAIEFQPVTHEGKEAPVAHARQLKNAERLPVAATRPRDAAEPSRVAATSL